MSYNKMICRVCGKEYDPCHTTRNNGTFRWQDVACCVEHGMEYLEKIRKSRAPKVEKMASYKKKTAIEMPVIEEPNIEPVVQPVDIHGVVETEEPAGVKEEKID